MNNRIGLQTLILNNLSLINRLVAESVAEYKNTQNDTKVNHFTYVPPPIYSFNGKAIDLPANSKSLYTQKYNDREAKKSGLENRFENNMSFHQKVELIGRNYDRHEDSYCVVYFGKDGKQHNFYPDFIIKLYDGRWLIIDTKDFDPEESAKKDALIKALDGTGVISGIVKERSGYFYIDRGNGEESFDDLIA